MEPKKDGEAAGVVIPVYTDPNAPQNGHYTTQKRPQVITIYVDPKEL